MMVQAFQILVAGAPLPVVATPTNYSGLVGPWQLIYVEANNLPAVLTFDVSRSDAPPPVPLPAGIWLFGSVVSGSAAVAWRRKRRANKATS